MDQQEEEEGGEDDGEEGGPANSGALAQVALTLWTNFAHSGDPNRPFSTRNLFPRHHGEREGGGPIAGIPSKAKRTWERYDAKKQRYLRLGLNPEMRSHYRVHAMSIWRHLIPRLHSAGANNIFPQHNAFLGHDDPDLFAGVVRRTSFSHGYQVNRKFFDATSPAPPSGTTCFPVDARGQIVVTGGITSSSSYSSSSDASGGDGAGGADSSSSLVRWQKASHHAYQNAMFLTIGVGTLLLAVNVWLLICLFFCRNRLSRCVQGDLQQGSGGSPRGGTGATSRMGAKEYSCQTELVGIGADDSVHSFKEIHPTVSSQTLSRRPMEAGGGGGSASRTGSLGREAGRGGGGGVARGHQHEDLQAATALQESLRLLQPSDSDRDSHSTSTASQQGLQPPPQQQQQQHRQNKGLPSESSKKYYHPHHHPRCHQQKQGDRGVAEHHTMHSEDHRPRKDSSSSSHQSQTNQRKSSLTSSSAMRTSSSNHQLSGSAGGPFQHTLDSSCRLHELAVAAAAAAAAQHYPSPAVAEGLSPSSVSAANTSSAATHLRGPGIVSPNGSSSTASSQGISVILPPPKEHQFPPQPAQLASSLKKPAGDASVSKLTTFSSIPVDTESPAVVGGGGNTPVVSFGGETILQ